MKASSLELTSLGWRWTNIWVEGGVSYSTIVALQMLYKIFNKSVNIPGSDTDNFAPRSVEQAHSIFYILQQYSTLTS